MPRIRISAQECESEWRIAVADNGIGIAPEYHRQIFGAFKRLHDSKIPGTGMGLAICKRIVERYGGQLWVESRSDILFHAADRELRYQMTRPSLQSRCASPGSLIRVCA